MGTVDGEGMGPAVTLTTTLGVRQPIFRHNGVLARDLRAAN